MEDVCEPQCLPQESVTQKCPLTAQETAMRLDDIKHRIEDLKRDYCSEHAQFTTPQHSPVNSPPSFERIPPFRSPTPPSTPTLPCQNAIPRQLFNPDLMQGTPGDPECLDYEIEPTELYNEVQYSDYEIANRSLGATLREEINNANMIACQDVPEEMDLSHIMQEYEPQYHLPPMTDDEIECAMNPEIYSRLPTMFYPDDLQPQQNVPSEFGFRIDLHGNSQFPVNYSSNEEPCNQIV